MRAACRALPRLGQLASSPAAPTSAARAAAACTEAGGGAARGANFSFSAAAGRGVGTGSAATGLRWAALVAGLGLGASGAAQLYGGGDMRGPAECQAGPAAGSAAAAGGSDQPRKTRVVVLGTGWGAVSFLKQLDPATYARECTSRCVHATMT